LNPPKGSALRKPDGYSSGARSALWEGGAGRLKGGGDGMVPPERGLGEMQGEFLPQKNENPGLLNNGKTCIIQVWITG